MPLTRAYRIFNEGRAPNDSMGARIAGGRWNPPGYPVLYSSSHLSLACLEKLVHLPKGKMPKRLRYAWTDLPGDLASLDPGRQHLHQGLHHTAEIGKQWLTHANALAVRAPSILIPEESNILLNPLHASFDALPWTWLPFDWDQRLLGLIAQP